MRKAILLIVIILCSLDMGAQRVKELSDNGQFTTFDLIFNSKTAVPTLMRPTSAVKGFGTALQNMHIGDLWKVYIPYALGYSTSNTTTIPAYSTLIFEIELIAYYRSGSNVPSWN